MYYIIYPDMLFLENFLCNLCFLLAMKALFFPNAAVRKIVLAGGAAALCNTLASILFFRCIKILQTGVLMPAAGLMVCACLNIKDPAEILYLLYRMTLWTLIFGGILQWAGQTALPIAAAAVGFLILLAAAEKLFAYYGRQNGCMREIVLCDRGRSCRVRAFADTGNQLFDPYSKKPVSIVASDVWEILTDNTGDPALYPIPYKSVGNAGDLLWGRSIDLMVIGRGKKCRIVKDPVIAVTKEPFEGIFHYSVLLHNEYC